MIDDRFTEGYLCAVQILAHAFHDDSLAEQLILESGIPLKDFKLVQKKSGNYAKSEMTKIFKTISEKRRTERGG